MHQRLRTPVPQEPADLRRDCVPVPPVGYDDEGYPVDDSVGQSQKHTEQRMDLYGTLRDWCLHHGLGEVFSDLFMPYREGQRNKVVCPELMVALRAERREDRLSYKLWEHPTPDFVLEATSNSTWQADVEAKKRLYRDLGVREYWLFDPTGERINERLRGYRLRRTSGERAVDEYGRVRENRWGRLASEVLRLELCLRDDDLRLYDPSAGELLLTPLEAHIRARELDVERARADREEAARQAIEQQAEAAENRIAALEAQLQALRQSD